MRHGQSVWEYRASERGARLALQRQRRTERKLRKHTLTRQGTTQTFVLRVSMVSTSRKIYRAEIFVRSRTTAIDTRNGGDSVGEGLHLGLGNCQLDTSEDGEYFRASMRLVCVR